MRSHQQAKRRIYQGEKLAELSEPVTFPTDMSLDGILYFLIFFCYCNHQNVWPVQTAKRLGWSENLIFLKEFFNMHFVLRFSLHSGISYTGYYHVYLRCMTSLESQVFFSSKCCKIAAITCKTTISAVWNMKRKTTLVSGPGRICRVSEPHKYKPKAAQKGLKSCMD